MKKNKIYYKLIIQTLFFISIFSNIYAKNVDNYYKASNISNYFSGVVSFYNNEHFNTFKYLKQLNGLEDKHYKYSNYYFYSLVNLGKIKEAYNFAKVLEKKKIDSFESNLILGVYNLKNGNYENSTKYFERLKLQAPEGTLESLISSSLYNWSSFDKEKHVSALKQIKEMPDQFKDLKDIQLVFAHCYFNLDNTENKFEDLLKRETDFSRYYFFYSNYLFKQKRVNEANKVINSAIKISSRNLLFNQMKIDLARQNKAKIALKNNFNCEKINDNIAELFYISSSALSSQSIYSNANFYLNLAKYLNPNFISYDTLYAENLFKMKEYTNAKKVLNKVSEKGQIYNWYASKQIANILFKENKKNEGIKHLVKVFEEIKNPSINEIYDFAEFLKNNERYERAIDNYSKLLKKIKFEDDIFSSVSEGRGVAYERSGKWEKAEKDLLNSLRKNPNQAYVINYLAYSWIEKGINVEKSLKMLSKAHELKKNDGYIIDSLGWALFKLKKFKEAKKYLQLAVTIMPTDPVINDHFGDSLWMNNKNIQARYYWEYVLNLKKTDEKLKKDIKKKLIYGLKASAI